VAGRGGPRSAAQVAAQKKAAAASAAKRRGTGRPKPQKGVGRNGLPFGVKTRKKGRRGKTKSALPQTRKALIKALTGGPISKLKG
jgi:hypothetical protein